MPQELLNGAVFVAPRILHRNRTVGPYGKRRLGFCRVTGLCGLRRRTSTLTSRFVCGATACCSVATGGACALPDPWRRSEASGTEPPTHTHPTHSTHPTPRHIPHTQYEQKYTSCVLVRLFGGLRCLARVGTQQPHAHTHGPALSPAGDPSRRIAVPAAPLW